MHPVELHVQKTDKCINYSNADSVNTLTFPFKIHFKKKMSAHLR